MRTHRLSVPAADPSRAAAVRQLFAAREAACLRMVTVPPSDGEVARDMTTAVLAGTVSHPTTLRTAHRWLQAHIPSGHVNGTAPSDPEEWHRLIASSGNSRHRLWLAWAMCVAAAEHRARRHIFDNHTRAFVELLAHRAGYQPTAWEIQQLTADHRRLPPRGARR